MKNKPQKIGTNGVPFGQGYKGKGMCKACSFSTLTQLPGRSGKTLYCGWYASPCVRVSWNCKGIISFEDPKEKENV